MVSFGHRTATISIFLSVAKCGPIDLRTFWYYNRQDRPRRFYRVGQKVRKNFESFTSSRFYVRIAQKLLKIEAYKQRSEKSVISTLSNCRMCLDPSVHALLRYRSKTAKMQKFPIDSHSNENVICLFFRPPGATNPQKGRRHVLAQATPACKIWRESARGLSRNR